jgi:hypothetical protein
VCVWGGGVVWVWRGAKFGKRLKMMVHKAVERTMGHKVSVGVLCGCGCGGGQIRTEGMGVDRRMGNGGLQTNGECTSDPSSKACMYYSVL